MSAFLDFFEQMPVWMKAGWVVLCIAIFWILEGNYSLLTKPYSKWKHARTNLSLLVFVLLINTVFGLATAGIFIWLSDNSFGLLNLIDLPIVAELILAILVLDLIAQYGVQYLLHQVPGTWRLHLVHHSDKYVDTTSGTRHHPLDFLIREIFALIAVLIMGMPISFYFFYRILTVFFTYWTHANLRLPIGVDKALSWVIVTPNMHKFHHHYQLPWTDSNYGNMFSIWDRLFGTFVYGDTDQIQYGVDIADHRPDQDLQVQLKLPFDRSVKSKGFRP